MACFDVLVDLKQAVINTVTLYEVRGPIIDFSSKMMCHVVLDTHESQAGPHELQLKRFKRLCSVLVYLAVSGRSEICGH